MNTRLLLTLGAVILLGFGMKDTLLTGMSLMTGRIETIDNGGSMPQTTPTDQTHPDSPDGRTIWEIESDRRIHLWRDCTYTEYRRKHHEECRRLHEGLDR